MDGEPGVEISYKFNTKPEYKFAQRFFGDPSQFTRNMFITNDEYISYEKRYDRGLILEELLG